MELHATPFRDELHVQVSHVPTELKKLSAKEHAWIVQSLNTLRAEGPHPPAALDIEDSFEIHLSPVIEQSLIWPLRFETDIFRLGRELIRMAHAMDVSIHPLAILARLVALMQSERVCGPHMAKQQSQVTMGRLIVSLRDFITFWIFAA